MLITRLFSSLSVLAGVLLSAYSAQATVLWKADFETGDLTEWGGGENFTKGTRKNIETVADPVADGKLSARVTLHPDDIFQPYNQNRVEVRHTGVRTGEGQDTYLSWSFYLPADAQIRDNIGYWESNSSYQNMMTFWIAPKPGGGTTINFGTDNLGRTRQWTADLPLNTWHRMAMAVHWSTNAQTGSVSIWFDGAKVVDAVKAKTKFDNNTLFFQTGLHRSAPAPYTETIYIDHYVEADALADVLAPVTPAPSDGGADPRGEDASTSVADGPASENTGGSGGSTLDASDPSGSGGASSGAGGSGGNTAPADAGARGGTGGSSSGPISGGSGQASGGSGCAIGGVHPAPAIIWLIVGAMLPMSLSRASRRTRRRPPR